MNYIINILIFLDTLVMIGQPDAFTKYTTDTLLLREFSTSKIVSYKIGNAFICVDYEEYVKHHHKLWTDYSKDSSNISNTGSRKTFRVLDSTYKLVVKEGATKDTVQLNQSAFDRVDLLPILNFAELIENNRCAIFDTTQKRHFKILRQQGKVIKGFNDGWGGRRYFLPGEKLWFYEIVDWIY